MTDAVETMAYANEKPWHGLGVPVKDTMTPKQMMKAAKLDWTVSKRPIFFEGGKQIPGKMALCRDTDDAFFSIVGKEWKPVQNEDALDFFTKWVKAGHMKMETAGSLWGGKYVWGLARIGKDFTLGTGKNADEVRSYLLMCSPHVRGKAMVLQFTPIRVVCWNTLNFALGRGLKGSGSAFRMIHSQKFDEAMKADAEEKLGIATEQMATFKEAAVLLSKKKITKVKQEEYFNEVLQFDPKAASKKKDGDAKEPQLLGKIRAALTHAPGQDITPSLGTWWGALNAVTYVVDHDVGRTRDTSLKNAWLGQGANLKRRALQIALDNQR